MKIITRNVSVTTTGSDGSATGTGTLPGMDGFLLDVFFNYHADAATTTDVTLTYTTQGGTLLTVSNSKTDALIAPRQTVVNSSNSAITNSHTMFPLNQAVTVSIAQGDALTNCLVATFRILQY